MKADGGSKGTAPHIFNFSDRWRSVANITHWPRFYPVKNPGTHGI